MTSRLVISGRLILTHVLALVLAAALIPTLAAQDTQQTLSASDLRAIGVIKDQGLHHSQLMDVMSWLTDVYGPRLTASPNALEAAEYAEKTLTGWGISNVHLEMWGPFGRSWQNTRFYLLATKPQAYPIIAYPLAWTPGTQGPVTAQAVVADLNSEQDFDQYRGKLRGKFVLVGPPPEVVYDFEHPDAHRFTADELAEMVLQPPPRAGFGPERIAQFRQRARFRETLAQFLEQEGAAAILWPGSARSVDGTVFNSGGGNDRMAGSPPTPPQAVLGVEYYGRIDRTLAKGIPVTLELDDENQFGADNVDSFNIIGEIPGSDPARAQQIVMIGGHFDSWHFATGATDNAAGSGVMMEAMRILKQSGLTMPRTVRIGLWTGEEEGLLGSRAYVKQHFADPQIMHPLPEHNDLDVYFNLDNGSGAIRGVYLQGNEMAAPIFEAWMRPFHDLGMNSLTIRNTGGTDHLSFDAVGLPGFQFIQDPIDYETRTHHSNMDTYERLQPYDLERDATIVAGFAYLAATRPEMFPREPLPPPQPPSPFDLPAHPAAPRPHPSNR